MFTFQIIMFSVIPLLTILFITLEHNGMISLSKAVFVSAVLDFLYSLALRLLAYFLRTHKSKTGEIEQVTIISKIIYFSCVSLIPWAKKLIASAFQDQSLLEFSKSSEYSNHLEVKHGLVTGFYVSAKILGALWLRFKKIRTEHFVIIVSRVGILIAIGF